MFHDLHDGRMFWNFLRSIQILVFLFAWDGFQAAQIGWVNWRDILLPGAVASSINLIGTMVFFGNCLPKRAARFLGDLIGMLVSILILVRTFSRLRRLGGTLDA
jgi:hypothetical protein